MLHDDLIETELGLLPAEWSILKLDKYVDLETGKRMKGGARAEVGILSIGGEHITGSGNILIDIPKYITGDFYDSLKQGKIQPGDVLMVKDGATTGKMAYVETLPLPRMAINEHVFIIRSKQPNILDNEYLYYALKSEIGQNQIRKEYHGLIGGVNRSDVKGMSIPLPHLPEQRAIAHVLSTVRQAFEATEQVIAAAGELKRSMIKYLFTYGPVPVEQAEQVPLKEVETGEYPEHWRFGNFEKFAILQRGFDITKKEQRSGTIPVVSSSGVKSYHNTPKVKGPGVIIGRKGSLGTAHYIDGDYWPHDTTLWVKDFKENHEKFLYYFLPTLKLENLDTGTSNPTLNRNYVHALEVAIPEKNEQILISEIIKPVEDKVAAESMRIHSLQELFNSLLNHLMMGKVRVVV